VLELLPIVSSLKRVWKRENTIGPIDPSDVSWADEIGGRVGRTAAGRSCPCVFAPLAVNDVKRQQKIVGTCPCAPRAETVLV
jgi:hypothetical protein